MTVLSVKSAALTDQGLKRSNNEDFVAFYEPGKVEELQTSGCLYVVADGVGGALHGERASQYAAEKVLFEYYRQPQANPGERLRQAIRLACNDIYRFSEDEHIQMATTLVAAVVRGDTLTIANVGDSRAYLIRNNSVHQITQDHTQVEEMVRSGLLTKEEASRAKGKNRLSRSLGGELSVLVDIFDEIPLLAGDKILLCSDGLTRYTNRQDLARLAGQGSPEEVVKGMVDYANQQGGKDNITALLVAVGQPVSATATTTRIERGHLPGQVDWDSMDTSPKPLPKPSATTSASFDPIALGWQYASWIILGVGLFLITAFGGYQFILLVNDYFSQNPAAAMTTTTVSINQTQSAEATQGVLALQGTQTPITIAATTQAAMAAPTNTPIPSPSPISTLSSSEHVCVAFSGDAGGGMFGLLDPFGPKSAYDPRKNYQYCVTEGDGGEFICVNKVGLTLLDGGPHLVPANVWVVIPEIDSNQECATGSGKWVPYQPPD